jgi:hemin uptake protein HemP
MTTGDPTKPAMPKVPAEEPPTISSRELLGERGLLRIEHGGEIYVLRVTRNRRLILTK